MLDYSIKMLSINTKNIDTEAAKIQESKTTTNRARLSDVLNP